MTLGAPYVVGSDTSYAAAASVLDKLNRLERIVFDKINDAGSHGCTDDELEGMTGLSHQTVSARRRTLVLKELIVDSGKRRLTSSGRKAAVWVRSNRPGVNLEKTPLKPTSQEAQIAVAELSDLYKRTGQIPSAYVIKLMKWFRWTMVRTG